MNNYEKRFREYLKENSDNIELVGKFKDLRTPTEFIDKICGHNFTIVPNTIKEYIKKNKTIYRHYECNTFLQNKNKINGEKRNAKKSFMSLLESLNGEYTLLPDSEYKTTKRKVHLLHTVCGYDWWKTPNDFMYKGNRCPNCSGKIKNKTTDMFKAEVFELVGDEYEVIGEYTKNDMYIDMKHNLCGKTYPVTPTNFLHGECRCPDCVEISRNSKGIRKIKKLLDDNNIEYETEVEFDDLYTTSIYSARHYLLKFDIKVIKENSFVLIEYDGRQHITGWNGNEDDKNKNIRNDAIKNKYCKDNNLTLIRISESEFYKIESILKENDII